MRQKLDIADVEERTKIRAKYLRALENEEWDLLPGHTFVKTFLRTYAEQVGVDPHVLVEEYRLSHEAEEPDVHPIASTPTRRDHRTRDRRRSPPPGPPRRGALLALAAVGFVVFLLVLGLFGEDEPGNEGATGVTEIQTTPSERAPPRRRPAPPSRVDMRVEPTFPTYVCVDAGEGTDVIYEGTLEEARTFRRRDQLRINLGKRSVDVRVNGKPVEIVDSPDPLGLEATSDGAEEIPAGADRPCA